MKECTLILKIILFAGLIFSCNPVHSQSKFELSGGIGLPELCNLKLRYGQNTQIGVSIGLYPFKWFGDNVVDWSCAAEISYHFSGKSKYVEQATWYILGGLAFHDLGMMNTYENYDIDIYPRIGRTLNFSKKSGINLDLGLFVPLSASRDNAYKFRLLPSGSIGLFIRL